MPFSNGHTQATQVEERPPIDREKRRRRSPSETRVILLEAGRRLMLSQGYDTVLPIKVTEVVESVGATTGAAYQIWKAQSDYQQSLAEYILATDGDGEHDFNAIDLVKKATSVDDAIRSVGAAMFKQLVARPDFYLHANFWSAAYHRPEFREPLREGYTKAHLRHRDALAAILDRFGYEVAAPWTLDDLTVSVCALLDGLALRHLVDPKVAGRHRKIASGPKTQDWDQFSFGVKGLIAGTCRSTN